MKRKRFTFCSPWQLAALTKYNFFLFLYDQREVGEYHREDNHYRKNIAKYLDSLGVLSFV